MANEIVVELKNGDAYLGNDGGEVEQDGHTYLVLENPRKIDIGPARKIKDANRLKILKAQIERVRKLDDI